MQVQASSRDLFYLIKDDIHEHSHDYLQKLFAEKMEFLLGQNKLDFVAFKPGFNCNYHKFYIRKKMKADQLICKLYYDTKENKVTYATKAHAIYKRGKCIKADEKPGLTLKEAKNLKRIHELLGESIHFFQKYLIGNGCVMMKRALGNSLDIKPLFKETIWDQLISLERTLDELHLNKVYIGDIKLENLVIDSEGIYHFIDLETVVFEVDVERIYP